MSCTVLPVRDVRFGVDMGCTLRIETPLEPLSEIDAQQLFEECASAIEERGIVGRQIFGLVVVLNSAEELVRLSPFLETMCNFIAEHPFLIVFGGRVHTAPLQLTIRVPSLSQHVESPTAAPDERDSADANDDIYKEATSRICCAFCHNDRLRVARFRTMNVPFVPNQELVNLLIDVSGNSGVDNDNAINAASDWQLLHHASYQQLTIVAARDRPAIPVVATAAATAAPYDILQVEVEGVNLAVEGTDYATTLMDRVLHVYRSGVDDPPLASSQGRRNAKFIVGSEQIMETVAARLHGHQTLCRSSTLEGIRLVAGTPANLAQFFRFSNAPPSMDGTALFRAALSIDSVVDLTLAGFRLNGDMFLMAGSETADPDSIGDVHLRSLAIQECVFPNDDPVHGVGALAASVLSQTRSITSLDLRGTHLALEDMSALCRALASSHDDAGPSSVHTLALGGTRPNVQCLETETVEHFFRSLPSLKGLRVVLFFDRVPAHLSRTVVDGMKYNYWVRELGMVPVEEADVDDEAKTPMKDEIWSYLRANANGRRAAMYDAVLALQEEEQEAVTTSEELADNGHHHCRQRVARDARVGAALQVLEQLSRSDHDEDLHDVTSRFLCVRMILPTVLGPRS